MKDSIAFAKGILDLTKSGKLEWVIKNKDNTHTLLVASYNESRLVYSRILDIKESSQMITYGLTHDGVNEIIVTKDTHLYIDDDKQEAFKLLTELGKLLDPDTIVPEVKVNLFDVTVNRFFQAFQ